MGRNIPSELSNPEEEKFLISSIKEANNKGKQDLLNNAEMIKAELELKLSEIEVLLNEVNIKFSGFVEGKDFSKKEESKLRKKIVGVFENRIKKNQKKKDNNQKIEEFEKIIEELKDFVDSEIEGLGDDGEIILKKENKEIEGVRDINKESEVSGDDNGANEDSMIDNDSDSVIVSEVGVVNNNGNDDIERLNIQKARKDKNFAEQMMGEDMEDIDKNSAEKEKEIVKKGIEEFIVEIENLLGEFDRKKNDFKGSLPNAMKIVEDMEKTKKTYQDKIEEFKLLEGDDLTRKKLTEINQLHARLCKVLELDWVLRYKEKSGIIVDKKNSKDTGNDNEKVLSDESYEGSDNEIEIVDIPLGDLSDHEYEGAHSPVIEKINRGARQEALNNLIIKYGDIGTGYVRYDDQGDLAEKLIVLKYELNGPDNNFIEFEIINQDGNEIKKINLKKIDGFLRRFTNESLLNIKNDIEPEDRLDLDEQRELEIFTREKIVEVDEFLNQLEEKYQQADKEKYSKEESERIEKKIQLYKFSLVNIRNAIKKEPGIFKSQAVLDLVQELHIKMKTLSDNMVGGSQDKNRESEDLISGFSESERKVFEKMLTSVDNLIVKMREKIDWGKLSDKRISQMVEDQVIIFLMGNFEKQSLFVDKEEVVAEFIIKNKK